MKKFYLIFRFLLLVASIQKLPAASVLTDINFPMKGRKGMVDWARNSEDRVVIPKNIFTPMSTGKEAYQHVNFVLTSTRELRVFVSQDSCIIWKLSCILWKRNIPIPEGKDGIQFLNSNRKCWRNPRDWIVLLVVQRGLKHSTSEPSDSVPSQQSGPSQQMT